MPTQIKQYKNQRTLNVMIDELMLDLQVIIRRHVMAAVHVGLEKTKVLPPAYRAKTLPSKTLQGKALPSKKSAPKAVKVLPSKKKAARVVLATPSLPSPSNG